MRDPPPVNTAPPPVQPVNSVPVAQHAAIAPQIQYVTYEVNGPTGQRKESGLGATVRTLGIIALSFMLVGFIPCLGWLNYLNIILSLITIVIGIVAIATAKSDTDRTSAILGVALVVIAISLGTGRLILGGGCI